MGGTTVFNKSRIDWAASGKEFIDEPENGWFNVLWQGRLLDVLFVTWTAEGCRDRHHWIIADDRKIAEDFLRAVCDWSTEVRGEILVFDGGYWYKDSELFDAIKSASFDNLILPAEMKREIQEDLGNFFASREVYDKYRIPWKRGVLLIGPPGNGKTHTVKALINQTKQALPVCEELQVVLGNRSRPDSQRVQASAEDHAVDRRARRPGFADRRGESVVLSERA